MASTVGTGYDSLYPQTPNLDKEKLFKKKKSVFPVPALTE